MNPFGPVGRFWKVRNMKLYDISQEVFFCAVYPGDPKPEKQILCSTGAGDLYNLSAFSMCAHNGTHIDAPFHFLKDGRTVDRMSLETFVGECFVARHEGPVTAPDAREILKRARSAGEFPNIGQHLDHPYQALEDRCGSLYGLFCIQEPENPESESNQRVYYNKTEG